MSHLVEASAAPELLVPSLRALSRLGPAIEERARVTGREILAADGLALASFQDSAFRIPHATALRLLDNAVEVSGDAAFGLRAGQSVERGDFGLFHLLTETAATLGESMHLAARYLPLLHDGASITITEKNGAVFWEHALHPAIKSSAAANEYVVAAFAFDGQRMLGFSGRATEIRFMHRKPAHAEIYEQVFRSPVRFGAERNTLVTPAAALSAPLATSDAVTHAILLKYADEQLKRFPDVHPFVRSVRLWIREKLAQGASLKALSRALHMSESGVQRRLAAVDTSHTEILDRVRRDVATALLAETDLNLSQIAYQLGFAHRPAFHRAFNRWYGCSPTEHRERNARSQFYRFHSTIS